MRSKSIHCIIRNGVGNGNPLLYSCLGNPTDRRAWGATVYRVAELDMTEHTCTHSSSEKALVYGLKYMYAYVFP